MDLSNDIEAVGKEIINLLGSSAFSARLASIATEKADDITLDAFRSRRYGWSNQDAETPALHVMGLREDMIRDEGDSETIWFKYAIEAYVSGDDPQKLEKLTNRYARAIVETLMTNYQDKGFKQSIEYSPTMKYEDSLFKVCSVNFWVKQFHDTRV